MVSLTSFAKAEKEAKSTYSATSQSPISWSNVVAKENILVMSLTFDVTQIAGMGD